MTRMDSLNGTQLQQWCERLQGLLKALAQAAPADAHSHQQAQWTAPVVKDLITRLQERLASLI